MKANKIFARLGRDVPKFIQHCEKLVKLGECGVLRSTGNGPTYYFFQDTSCIKVEVHGVSVRGAQ